MTDGIRLSKLKYFSQRSYPPPTGLRNPDQLRRSAAGVAPLREEYPPTILVIRIGHCCSSILLTMSHL